MKFLSRFFNKTNIIQKTKKYKLDEEGRRILREINLSFRYYTLPKSFEREYYEARGLEKPEIFVVSVPFWYIKTIHNKYMDEKGVVQLNEENVKGIIEFVGSKGYPIPTSYITLEVECIYEEEK